MKLNDAFYKWFGDSHIVDKSGKPLVVYHGTDVSIEKFEMKQGGMGTGNPGAKVGYFFTPSQEMASYYASKGRGREGANVIPVYLSIKNPAYTTFRDNPTSTSEAIAFRKTLLANGYDGVIMDSVDNDAWTANEIIALHSSQIKSAIANDGTWDLDDYNIRSNPRRRIK